MIGQTELIQRENFTHWSTQTTKILWNSDPVDLTGMKGVKFLHTDGLKLWQSEPIFWNQCFTVLIRRDESSEVKNDENQLKSIKMIIHQMNYYRYCLIFHTTDSQKTLSSVLVLYYVKCVFIIHYICTNTLIFTCTHRPFWLIPQCPSSLSKLDHFMLYSLLTKQGHYDLTAHFRLLCSDQYSVCVAMTQWLCQKAIPPV